MEASRPCGWKLVGLCLVLLFPTTAFGRSGHHAARAGVCGDSQTMLEAQETGSAMVQQVLRTGMPWSDNALNEYVNRLGQNLARSSGSHQAFNFYVIYNPQVNAQAFPGGYIVVNTGVLSLAENEAELAAVLSHEIAHENSCDWQTGPRKGNLIEMIALVPTVVLGGPAGVVLAAGGGWAATVARARFSRAEEERADRLAAEYLVRAGYDPRAAVRFFARLEMLQNGAGEERGVMATHPRNVQRQKNLEKVIALLPPPEIAVHDDAEFTRLRQSVINYDEMYTRLVGVRTPGHDLPPPQLSRRLAAQGGEK